MVDFPICRKVSLGSEDAIDTTARGQSESKVARQHLLALNRALLRLVASTLNRKCARFRPLRALCLFPTGCWKVDYKMGAKKMKELEERVSCPVLSMSQDFCVNKVFQGGGDDVATLRRFHSHD